MVSSAKYHGDAFLGLANGLVESFSWTADKGEALLAVYLDPSLDDQRGIFLAALNRFPRAQREDILKRAALDPVLRPDVEERLDRQFRRAGVKKRDPSLDGIFPRSTDRSAVQELSLKISSHRSVGGVPVT